MKYNGKKATTVTNLVETTWLVQYQWPVEITYDQGGEFLGHKFKFILIEQVCGIKTKHAFPGNTQANKTIERIHQVPGNLIRTDNQLETYVDIYISMDGNPSDSSFHGKKYVALY